MIKLTVQTYNGAPLPKPLVAQFDELGGTIGRADTNQLVLPDPERSISRVHAQVVFRNGGYAVVDRGSNPVMVNGRPLGNGAEAPLSAGDQLQIGGYAIRVDAMTAAHGSGGPALTSASDPFADLGGMAFNAPPAAPPRPAAPGGLPTAGPGADPMAAFGFSSGGGGGGDPFGFGGGAPAAGHGGGFGGSGHGAAPTASAGPGALGGIPEDWDPFAPEPVKPPSPQDLARSLGSQHNLGLELGGGAAAPLIPDMADLGGGKANTASSIDAMFGLSSGSDPLAGSILAPASVAPNMANHIDPMRSLNTVNAGSATAAPDNVSALNQPFMEAPMAVAKPAAAPAPSLAPAMAPPLSPASSQSAGGVGGAGAGGARGAVLSWDDGAQEGRTVIRPKGGAATVRPAAATPAATGAPSLGDFDSFGTVSAHPPARPVPGATATAPAAAPQAASEVDPMQMFGLGGGSGQAHAGGIPADAFADLMPAAPALAPASLAPQADPLIDPLAAASPARFAPQAAAPAAANVAPAAPPAGHAPAPSAQPAVAAVAPTSAVAPAAAPPQAATPAPSADQAALIAALREGLGMPALPIQSLTPDFMKLLGQLVHEATKGTVELLVARAALKREIRAEVTMIVAKENNPLKFSPSVDVALNHLLSPPARGFMPPAPAMRDAYDDLRAHQFAFVAGMRAALEGVLKRFDPAVLEGKLTQKSVLSTLLPASRKAKMWDVFTDLYGHISAEASDDFHELFGKEFLRAYEEQIDQLQRDA